MKLAGRQVLPKLAAPGAGARRASPRVGAVAVLVALVAAPGMVRADPAVEYASGEAPRALQVLQATGCDVSVELRGAVATVETREQITNAGNAGAAPRALREDLAMPAGAVVIGAAIVVDGKTVPAVAVPAQFPTAHVEPGDVLGPDPLLVQARPGGEVRAVIQPIAPGHAVTLITRYVELAELAGGSLRLALPGRADQVADTCRGAVHATPGPGARIAGIQVAGHPAARGAFTLGRAPAAIDVALDIAGTAPVVWTQREPLDAEWSATLVTVAAPLRTPRTGASRALFVIDGSRSMALVGMPRVIQVMRAIAGALPASTELDAIVYDRTAARVLGEFRPASAGSLDAIEASLRRHAAGNGSDLAAALAVAHRALAGTRGRALVIAITDGVLGGSDGPALIQALDSTAAAVAVHAILLDPAHTRNPPGYDAIRAPIDHYGGTLVEVDTGELDHALASLDDWLRPAALELALIPAPITPGTTEIPGELRAGRGFTRLYIHRTGAPELALTGHGEAAFRVAARPAPAAPIAQLALAGATIETFTGPDNPSALARASAQRTLAHARALHPSAGPAHAFAALASAGQVAASRRAMIAGGGPYERTAALADPPSPAPPAPAASGPAPSAIDRLTLERLFRDQLSPRAYVCYQRALGTSPRLAGTATFELHIGRGEVSQVAVTGVADPVFEACLVDAGYALQPPLPDFAVNADDQTVAHYPLSFTVRDDHPLIMAGDADSSSPLDIEAIQGGVPERRRPIHLDASTPLGGLPKH